MQPHPPASMGGRKHKAASKEDPFRAYRSGVWMPCARRATSLGQLASRMEDRSEDPGLLARAGSATSTDGRTASGTPKPDRMRAVTGETVTAPGAEQNLQPAELPAALRSPRSKLLQTQHRNIAHEQNHGAIGVIMRLHMGRNRLGDRTQRCRGSFRIKPDGRVDFQTGERPVIKIRARMDRQDQQSPGLCHLD